MSESERLKVLKLLEEGKINAEEAARLLEALGEPRRRARGLGVDLSDVFEIPDMVCRSMRFAHPFMSQDEGKPYEFVGKKRVVVKGVSGDLEIKGVDGDKITVVKDGIGQVVEAGDEVLVRTISGDAEITLPRAAELHVASVSGDIEIENLETRVEVNTASGDIQAKKIKGDFIVAGASGDIEVDLEEVGFVDINSRSGDVDITVGPEVRAVFELSTKSGEIECGLPLEKREQSANALRGVYLGEKGRIRVRTYDGDITVNKR